MAGGFDSRKDSDSKKFKQRPRIFAKLSFRELCDSKLSDLHTFGNMTIIHSVFRGSDNFSNFVGINFHGYGHNKLEELFADLYIEPESPPNFRIYFTGRYFQKRRGGAPSENTKKGEASDDNFIRHTEIFQTK